jgi:hypothetical protein
LLAHGVELGAIRFDLPTKSGLARGKGVTLVGDLVACSGRHVDPAVGNRASHAGGAITANPVPTSAIRTAGNSTGSRCTDLPTTVPHPGLGVRSGALMAA